MHRQRVPAGTKWESVVGYSRAVRAGQVVVVAGTTGLDAAGNVVGVDDAGAQTRQTLANVVAALEQLGARREDVIRTRIFVTDIERWEEVGRAHGEFFGEIRPAVTMVEVCRLIDPAMLVEIEAEAVLE
jgi:enamine deaminase RidA (YjgF/YER057c/UK114 family)